MRVTILDYGSGNLRSVQKALSKVGAQAEVTGDPQTAVRAERMVPPGVGAFGDCIGKLRAAGLDRAVVDHIRQDKPFLGICVGMQILFTTGYEDGTHAGLGVLEGEVVRLPSVPGFKVPHMGWNQAKLTQESPLWNGLPDPAWFYFVHSYHCVPKDRGVVAMETEYMVPFCSAVRRGRLVATQFHPEKSQAAGLYLLEKFLKME